MNSPHIKDDVEITLPIVKIAWMCHNRKYEIGIQSFLRELGVDISDESVLTAVRKILSQT